MSHEDIAGPYIVWTDYGYDGWKPTSYVILADAVAHVSYGSNFIITKRVIFEVTEK